MTSKSFDLETFTFNGHMLRTVVIDGKPWFVFGDVLLCMGVVGDAFKVADDPVGQRFLGGPVICDVLPCAHGEEPPKAFGRNTARHVVG